MLESLKQDIDLVIGSRFVNCNGKNVPAYHRISIKFSDVAIYISGRINVTDSQSGFRAYRKKAIKKIHFNGEDMSAGSEILLQAKDHGFKFTEVEVHCRYNLEECSSQNFKILS